jgi:flagellar hook assembly protein FlgD
LEITGSAAYPVPFQDELKVWIQHTLPGENLTVKWKILDAQGRLIREGESFHESAPAKMTVIDWDGSTQNGAEIYGGVYFYQLLVLTEDGLENQVGGKFVKSQ